MTTLDDVFVLSTPRAFLDHDGVLERIALALNSTLELREVLRALAGETLSLAGVGRTSLFLIDDGSLHPVASRATSADEDLWDAFQRMAPIPLTPERNALLRSGRAVVVDEPAASRICPPEWIARFEVRCIVLVPLLAGGEPCGLMSIDFPHPRTFPAEELRVLQAIGAFAGVAVRNARAYEAARRTARLQAGLADATAALASVQTPDEVAGRLRTAALELVAATGCVIVTLDRRRNLLVPLTAPGRTEHAPMSVDVLPPEVRERIDDPVADERGRACVVEPDSWLAAQLAGPERRRVVVVPLVTQSRVAGAVLLQLDAATKPDAESLAVAEALGAITGAALDRHRLLQQQQQQLRRLDILYRLSSVLAERTDAKRLVDTLNSLVADLGFEAVGMAFRTRDLTQHLGGDKPTPEEKAAWRADAGPLLLRDGTLAVPMRLGRRVVGSLRVQPQDVDDEDLAFLEALAAGVAAVVHRGALRTAVEEAARERAVAAERNRIAADLHDTVGQQFVALGLMANRLVEHIPPASPWAARVRRLAELASGGKFEIDQAVRALAFVPAARRGVVPAVRGLSRLVARDSGLDIVVEITGRPVRLQPAAERALYRVVHEALTNAWRHARCSTVCIEVAFGAEAVSVTVRDDGVGLGRRGASGQPNASVGDQASTGVWSMRRNVAEVGGRVRIRNGQPRGVEVVASVPRGAR